MVSELFDEARWREVPGFAFGDISYHRAVDQGTVRIAFDRPEVRNAFRPASVDELYRALDHARMTTDVGCILLTGNGPSPKDGVRAFCSGGDQRIRGRDGYRYAAGEDAGTNSSETKVCVKNRVCLIKRSSRLQSQFCCPRISVLITWDDVCDAILVFLVSNKYRVLRDRRSGSRAARCARRTPGPSRAGPSGRRGRGR